MLHADGSWARATATGYLDSLTVHQGGLPLCGARARIDPDGTLTLSRGAWSLTVE
ncbi:hypothetical protein [Streptomyces sp. YS415]|uniref:hypothetical protein n=1 Tax=Streptomyces sp. YS415 TaxID=2944806 RepID=UPI002020655D|nr:hypothetical protein [Streptomyces sp. YS415]MCL7429862.1 hypothetical protein [Streptomyces sp. YS415]